MQPVATYTSTSAELTQALGKEIALLFLLPGSVVVLRGELGAGKTQLTKGIASAFGLAEEDISSPTFSLANEYQAEWPDGRTFLLFHLDCYRFENEEELLQLGVEEYLYPAENVSVIEWPERIEGYLPPHRIEISLKETSPTERIITVSTTK